MEQTELQMMKKVMYGLLLALVISNGVVAQESPKSEHIGFFEGLRAQEDKAHRELENQIVTMTRDEYTEFMLERLEKAFGEATSSLKTFVVVDVSDEVNRPEPGIFERLFSTTLDPKDFGKTKVADMLAKSNGIEDKASLFVLKEVFRSQNRMKWFQRLEGMLDKESAQILASQTDVVEVYVPQTGDGGSAFITTHTPTGRIIPPPGTVKYSEEFVAAGLRNELEELFKTHDRLPVMIGFKYPENYDGSKSARDTMAEKVDAFLNSWKDYEIDVLNKSFSYVVLSTTKAHVEAMREDDAVKRIRFKDYRLGMTVKGN